MCRVHASLLAILIHVLCFVSTYTALPKEDDDDEVHEFCLLTRSEEVVIKHFV